MTISIISFFCSGCKKDDLIVNPPLDVKGIIPMAIGSQWNYNIYSIDSIGIQQLMNTDSYKITEDTIINNFRWYKFSEIIKYPWQQPSEFLCANTRYGCSSLHNSTQFVIFRYPSNVQDSFYVNNVVNYLHIISVDT